MQVAEMKRNVTPETPDFPLLVKKGSATVKIYEVKNRDRKNDTVSYLRAVNGPVRRTFDAALLRALWKRAGRVYWNIKPIPRTDRKIATLAS